MPDCAFALLPAEQPVAALGSKPGQGTSNGHPLKVGPGTAEQMWMRLKAGAARVLYSLACWLLHCPGKHQADVTVPQESELLQSPTAQWGAALIAAKAVTAIWTLRFCSH